ncbi:MAG: HAMP domain-containing histidine kinase, partial [Acidimicrobiales bacterium]|nr:HAMP domain-containing histidine kinase [Acidimicrobiales bacterium]
LDRFDEDTLDVIAEEAALVVDRLRERTRLAAEARSEPLTHPAPERIGAASSRGARLLRIALLIAAAFSLGAGLATSAALARRRRLLRVQSAFIANTSHELRTPLAAMRAEVDVALDDRGADADDLRGALEAIGEELEHTTGLVASMLALARAEAVADPGPCDLAEAAGRALDLVDEAWRSSHDVQVALAPAVVDGDPVLLAQLAANLVGNACKYDRDGGLLRVEVRPEGDEAVLLVENDGPPVDPATVGSLFARFVRRSEHGEGYGLGLAIVHTIVASHGGRIAAVARPEGGLRVEVRLPRRRA